MWWAPPRAAPAGLVRLLDGGERRRLAGLRREPDRARFLAAHALVRVLLGAYVGARPAALEFEFACGACGGPHGKPRLRGGRGPEFSLSHAGDRVVVAVAHEPVGVDVEETARDLDWPALAADAFAPAERVAARPGPGGVSGAEFLCRWTRKEAVLKAAGVGLAAPPADLAVPGLGEPPRVLAWAGGAAAPGGVRLADLDLGPGHAAAVALLTRRPHAVLVCDGSALFSSVTNNLTESHQNKIERNSVASGACAASEG